MNNLMKFFLAYVLDHPNLVEIDIVVVAEDRRFVFVLVGALFGYHQYFFCHGVEYMIVVAGSQLYSLDLCLHIIYAIAL